MMLTLIFLIGEGYEQSSESDILLLDISKDGEYIWTDSFIPSIPSATPSKSSNNKPIIIGTVIGSLIGASILATVCFLIYKWKKNKKEQKNAIPTPGKAERNDYHANLVIPTKSNRVLQPPKNENRSNHEPVDTNNVYNNDNNGQASNSNITRNNNK